jgi:hypothetical protein
MSTVFLKTFTKTKRFFLEIQKFSPSFLNTTTKFYGILKYHK